jgi:hypothetical protein
MTRSILRLVAVSIAAFAGTVVVFAQREFSAERIKAHVTFLADDLLEGREAGTRGHELAARYVASQFALLGVKPAGEKGTYFETVDLAQIDLVARPTLTIATPRGQRTLTHKKTALVYGPMNGGAVAVRAPMVFVGYGMQDSTLGYDDYAGLDVRNKVVVALWDAPKGLDSEIGAHLRIEQRRMAAAHQSAALVSVLTRQSAKAFPWDAVLRFGDEPTTT